MLKLLALAILTPFMVTQSEFARKAADERNITLWLHHAIIFGLMFCLEIRIAKGI